VIDDSRGYIAPWAEATRRTWRIWPTTWRSARGELAVAGVQEDPDAAGMVAAAGVSGPDVRCAITVTEPTDVEGAVAEFHRINAEARLIEARARSRSCVASACVAVGEVERLADAELPHATGIEPIAPSHVDWRVGTTAPVYAMSDVCGGRGVRPAAISSPFTTVILSPGEVARVTATGDMVIDLPVTAGWRDDDAAPRRAVSRGPRRVPCGSTVTASV
jgi:hypothetical protein